MISKIQLCHHLVNQVCCCLFYRKNNKKMALRANLEDYFLKILKIGKSIFQNLEAIHLNEPIVAFNTALCSKDKSFLSSVQS